MKKRKSNSVNSMISAAGRLGIRIEAVQMCKSWGSKAFMANGRINCSTLQAFLTAHPEIAEAVARMPDAKLERALKYQAERRLKEAELGVIEGDLIKKSDVVRDVTRYSMATKFKLLSIPKEIALRASLTDSVAEIEEIFRTAINRVLTDLYTGPWFDASLEVCPQCGHIKNKEVTK